MFFWPDCSWHAKCSRDSQVPCEFEMLNSTLTINLSTLAWSNGRVGFYVQFLAMLYTCVSLDILKSTLSSRLLGLIPGHAHVYNFFNSFFNLQDQLYIIYTGLHWGLWFNLNKTCDQIPIAALKTPQPMSHSILFHTSTTATWTAILHLLFCGTCLV